MLPVLQMVLRTKMWIVVVQILQQYVVTYKKLQDVLIGQEAITLRNNIYTKRCKCITALDDGNDSGEISICEQSNDGQKYIGHVEVRLYLLEVEK